MNQLFELDVTETAYATAPDISLTYYADSFMFLLDENVSGDVVYFSFDGTNDSGKVIAGLLPAVSVDSQRKQVWLRRSSGSASTVAVSVMLDTRA